MRKKLKISINAPVTISFTMLCIVAFLFGMISGGRITGLIFMTYHSPISLPGTWVRFFTHVLGHGSMSHLMGNLTYILLLGPLLEEKYGSAFMIKVILLTAFVTGLVNYVIFPGAGLLGASGVVFSFIILSSITGVRQGEIPLTFILVTVIYLGQQVYEGIFLADNVANFAHIIGGLIGALAGFGFFGERG